MSQWRTVHEWRDAWDGFFSEERRERLARLLDAPSCREAWVQAEAHCHFRALPSFNFYCNTAKVPSGKADFAEYTSNPNDGRLRFLAELKWLGADHQPKILTGRHAGVRMLCAAHPDLRPVRLSRASETEPFYLDRGWSLLRDYFRLLHAPYVETGTVRFLITILDLRWQTDLGSLLSRVEFDGPAILDLQIVDHVYVRIWNITSQPNG